MKKSVKPQRPPELDEFLDCHKIIKEKTARKAVLLPTVKAFVMKHPQRDYKIVVTPFTSLDNVRAMEWAKNHLTQEQYKSLFVKAFDPDKFMDLKDVLFEKDKKLAATFPADIITTGEREAIHPILSKD